MKVLKTIRPGDKGSRRYLKEWGEELLMVRYREDPRSRTVVTTLEVIVDQRPHLKQGEQQMASLASANRALVHIRLHNRDQGLRKKIIASRGQWDQERKSWLLPYEKVVALGLKSKIVANSGSGC